MSKQPRSPKQIEQSRINGRKSKGPSTAEGKAASSKNAITHGLTANLNTVLDDENPAEYAAIYDAWVDDLRPATGAELRLVEKIANLDWRMERFVMLETALFSVELALHDPAIKERWTRLDSIGYIVEAFKAASDKSKSFDTLRRYMASLQSQFNANLKNFRNLEAARLSPRRSRDLDFEPPYQKPTVFPPQPPQNEPEPQPQPEPEPPLQNEPGEHVINRPQTVPPTRKSPQDQAA